MNHTGPKLVQIQDLYRIQRRHLESYLTIKTRGKERKGVVRNYSTRTYFLPLILPLARHWISPAEPQDC